MSVLLLSLLAAAAVVIAPVSAQQKQEPEIVAKDGDLYVSAADQGGSVYLSGDTFLNGEQLVANTGLQAQLDTLRLGLAGATLGPDATVTVMIETPLGTPAYEGAVTAAWSGLTAPPERMAYDDLPTLLLSQLRTKSFCLPPGSPGGIGRVSVSWSSDKSSGGGSGDDDTPPPSSDIESRRAMARVAPEGTGCVAAKSAVENVFATLAMSLRGELLASRTGAETRARLSKVEALVSNVDLIAKAALDESAKNRKLVDTTVADAIKDLTADINDIHGCHKDGKLYSAAENKCVSPVARAPCIAVPPGAPAARASVVDSDVGVPKKCSAATRTPGGGGKCVFRCDAGFTQVGSFEWTCGASGLWERVGKPSSNAECVPVECGDPRRNAESILGATNLNNRRSFFEETAKGSSITGTTACGTINPYSPESKACVVECQPGFDRAPLKTVLVCGTDGKWTRRGAGTNDMFCPPVKCPTAIPAGTEANLLGNSKCPDVRFGQKCPLACADGYEGMGETKCGSDGKWKISKPYQCRAKTEHGFFLLRDQNLPGCPDPNRNINELMVKEFELMVESVIWITAHMIREAAGRDDIELYVDDKIVDRSLTWSTADTWKELHLTWAGTLSAGKHTVRMRGLKRSVFGCNDAWASMEAFWISSKHAKVVTATQVTGDCPQTKPGTLVQEFFEVTSNNGAAVIAAGHIITKKPERADLTMLVNNEIKDRALGWTDPEARDDLNEVPWTDHHTSWVGKMPKGDHVLQLVSSHTGWGCGNAWGDFQVMVVEDEGLITVENVPGPAGCSAILPGGTTIMAKTIDVPRDNTILMIVAHLIVEVSGRADFQIHLDGTRVAWSLSHTDTTGPADTRSTDARAKHIASVSAGKHRIEVRSDRYSAKWGCNGGSWADLDIILIG